MSQTLHSGLNSRTSVVAMFLLLAFTFNVPFTNAQQSEEHLVERTYSESLSYRCLVSLPDNYDETADRKWPLILFLHGGGRPNADALSRMIRPLTDLPAIVVAPSCPPSKYGERYTNWDWKMLGEVVREVISKYQIDESRRSVIGFSMGGSAAWELPSFEPKLFSKSVVIAGVCHPWSLRHYPKTKVWVFVGLKDYMRKEQQETVTSARRFKVDVVESTWKDADHGGVFRKAMSHRPMLDWLVNDEDLRQAGEIR